MNILDVINNCIKNPRLLKDYDIEESLSSKYTFTADPTITHISDYSGYSNLRKESFKSVDQSLLRLYMRAWTGLGRYIMKIIADGNCFYSLDLGCIFPVKVTERKCGYSPLLETLEKYGLSLAEDEYNIHPLKRNVISISRI